MFYVKKLYDKSSEELEKNICPKAVRGARGHTVYPTDEIRTMILDVIFHLKFNP
jgi:hypothetical protein